MLVGRVIVVALQLGSESAFIVLDILAFQISTVASESAFSTGGRSRKPINVDSLEDLFNDDEIVKDMEYELEKISENYKGEQNSHWYTLRELEAATDGFVDENVIGQGGMVLYYCFRGIVADGTQVAVKNLLNNRYFFCSFYLGILKVSV
ncbi:hypothetical protein Tco_0852632 [Tanacetum coccineum]